MLDRVTALIKRLLNKAHVDRPVFFALATRAWAVTAGPISALLIAARFSPEIQGYYYTFGSLVALQVFVELGLGIVVVHSASHEWARLNLTAEGSIAGDALALSRLRGIAAVAVRWFVIGALLLVTGLTIAGSYFFGTGPDLGVHWRAPWLVLCGFVGVNVALTPAWSLLEGCNQVARLYRFRFFQGIVVTGAIWVAILVGADLWAAPIMAMATALTALYFLLRRYALFLRDLLLAPIEAGRPAWRTDIFPMQWRIAVSWVSGYFVVSIFVPVLFKLQGPVVAGQMGMTWSLIGALGFATAWLSPKVPQFGMLVAERKFAQLDHLFWKVSGMVAVVTLVLATLLTIFVYGLNLMEFSLAQRLLPLAPASLFLAGQCLSTMLQPVSAYLRAHKREPLMAITVVMAISIATTTLAGAWYSGVLGVAAGYFVVNAFMFPVVVFIWRRCRREWHSLTSRERGTQRSIGEPTK